LKYQLFYEDKKTKCNNEKFFMNAIMSLEKEKHYPVMLDQVLSIITPQHGGTFIDCTFGGGSYSRAILKYPGTKVIGIDGDKVTQTYANHLLKKYPKRFNFFKDKFSNIDKIIENNIKPKAIIFDLGLSSFQLNDEARAFSFESENILDMEMGLNNYSAYDVINTLDKEHLTAIIKILGEEKDGRKIANKIDRCRKKEPIKTSKELASIINSVKNRNKNYKKNPATKTFQAIRMFVNQELSELILGLINATSLLKDGGILVLVSFHSLEDKIIKNFFNLYSNFKSNPSRYLPLNEKKASLFKLISKKPLTPNEEEINENNPSRSAKLRYAVRSNDAFFYPDKFKNSFLHYFELEEGKI